MTSASQGTIDSLDFSDVFERDLESGPKATLYIPTDPTGAKNDIALLTLKNQLRDVSAQLVAAGLSDSEAAAVLAPAQELIADSSYWRLQSRGLVVFAARGFHRAARIPIEVGESATVGDNFDVLPLGAVLESNRRCYVLALSKGSVRLFDATRNTVDELPLEGIPESFDDVIGELPEQSFQFRAIGGGDVAFYGQGGTGETESMLTEKFIHAVGKAVGERLGTARSQPLVLAAVAEYLPMFKNSCPYPAIHHGVIAGNPEHTSPHELRSAAWRLLTDSENTRDAEEQDRARSLAHNGKGAFDFAEIAKAAEEGRVETLYLPREAQQPGSTDSRALANRALLATIRESGRVRTLEAIEGEALAVFRY